MIFEIVLMAIVVALVISAWVFIDLDKDDDDEYQTWADEEAEEDLR